MGKKIYKYAGISNIDRILPSGNQVTLKCSLPSQFNDPYELFLTVDFNDDPDTLAFYADAIGEIPEFATTCFAASPINIPMWAHYAQTLEGFVIEFDENIILESTPSISFNNVEYRNSADPGLTEMLHWASEIGKPRHLYRLQQAIMHAAYFTKLSCWTYEQERRLVANEDAVRKINDIILIDLPRNSVNSLIAGPRATPDTVAQLIKKADELNASFYQFNIGKTSPTPYLLDKDDTAFIFNGSEIIESPSTCDSCNEPTVDGRDVCAWCKIDDSHRAAARNRNPFRIYAEYGLLEDYLNNANSIRKNKK